MQASRALYAETTDFMEKKYGNMEATLVVVFAYRGYPSGLENFMSIMNNWEEWDRLGLQNHPVDDWINFDEIQNEEHLNQRREAATSVKKFFEHSVPQLRRSNHINVRILIADRPRLGIDPFTGFRGTGFRFFDDLISTEAQNMMWSQIARLTNELTGGHIALVHSQAYKAEKLEKLKEAFPGPPWEIATDAEEELLAKFTEEMKSEKYWITRNDWN